MNTSPEINELAAALARAQAVMEGAKKDAANPFFKSKYADLESVWSACRKALTEQGLSVVQVGLLMHEQEPIPMYSIVTRLLHSSGQWIEGTTPVKAKDDTPQAMGSAITYARRYGLAAMVGVYQTDDDAEAAQGRDNGHVNRDLSPHSDVSHVPAHIAEKYSDAFLVHYNANNPAGVYQVHLDLKQEGEEVYQAAWQRLGSQSAARRAIKEMIASQQRGAAA